jgi:hypothetical protein
MLSSKGLTPQITKTASALSQKKKKRRERNVEQQAELQ